MIKAHCCGFSPIPRNERNLTRQSRLGVFGSDGKAIVIVDGATAIDAFFHCDLHDLFMSVSMAP